MANFFRPALVVLILGSCGSTHAAFIRRVVGTGDPVPGVANATFTGGGWPSFDSQGNVRVSANIAGPGISWDNSDGVWMESNGSLKLVYRQGDPLPGGNGSELISQRSVSSNALDWVSVSLNGPLIDALNDQALLALDGRDVRTVARTGQQAPGMPEGTTFVFVGYPPNDLRNGPLLFDARIIGPGINVNNDHGLWVDDGNRLRRAVQEGDIAPVVSSPFRQFQTHGVDGQGRAVFRGAVDSLDPERQHQWGVYAERNSRIEHIVQERIQAPGLPEGVMTRSIWPYVKANGTILLSVELSGTEVNSDNDTAVYVERGDGLGLLFREGDPIPNVPQTARMSIGPGGSREDVLVSAYLLDSNEQWELTENGWRRFTWPQWRDRAPGTRGSFGNVGDRRTNSFGRRAFEARLDEEDGIWSDAEGIWADDENGMLQLVMLDGDLVETSPGTFAALDRWELIDFNDRGEVLIRGSVDGFVGVYAATLNPVPEPTSMALLIVATGILMAAYRANRRRRGQP